MAHQRTPKYRLHRPSGQALVQIAGRRIYLGRFDSPESREKYHRLLAEHHAAGPVETGVFDDDPPDAITVSEVAAAFWQHCEEYYRHADGRPTSELANMRQALKPLRKLYATLPAQDFGPLKFKAVRQELIDQNLSRGNINRTMKRIRLLFSWAVENELIPPGVSHALREVKALKAGRSAAKEPEPVKPVPLAHVDATLDFVTPQVAAVARLQLLTGARPGEIILMRGLNLDTTGRIWVYRPEHHKTAWHGHQRTIYLGPQAQAIVKPFLKLDMSSFLFSPRDAKESLWAERRAGRKSPLTPSQADRKRKSQPRRPPRESYTVQSYARAIARACKRAGVPHWHPHQLRHARATELRKEFGIEVARIILGHRSSAITEVYAETDHARAVEVMGRIG